VVGHTLALSTRLIKHKLLQDNTLSNIKQKRKIIMAQLKRYQLTLRNHGLRDYDVEKVKYVFDSSSAKDAIRRVEKVYKLCERNNVRLSYYSKQFLEALAISAETDLHEIK
tara:strand:+ start:1760 stop:2092 length:333 start_codon:yes stop_codon:yes gene_type:complete